MKFNTVTVLLVVAGIAFIGFMAVRRTPHSAPTTTPTPASDLRQPAEADAGETGQATDQVDKDAALLAFLEETDVALGDPTAPVVLVEFGDYQCTFCTRFFFDTKATLVEDYVDTGVLRYVFRDFPVNGKESQQSAEASECANEQGAFWEYHDKLYLERTGYNTGAFSRANLIKYADDIGLDVAAFTVCYDEGRYEDEVAQDMRDGRTVGVSGTPTFFINGQRLVGAQPTEVFVAAIEQLARE